MADFDLLGQLESATHQKKVSIVDFAESPNFCNKVLYPRQRLLLKLFFLEDLTEEEDRILDYWIAGGAGIHAGQNEITVSPHVRERVKWLKENGYRHFREIVLVGGRRCSKGFMTGLAMTKLMYDCLQLQDPGAHYGIDRDKEIYFSVLGPSLDNAKKMQYADFSGTVNSCMALQQNIAKAQELEFSVATESDMRQLEAWKRAGRRIQRDTAKLRGNALPANARSIRGSATMAIVFDEFAHFMQGESDQADAEIYEAAIPALAQFGRDAMIFCNSSPYSKVGKFHERFDEAMSASSDGPTAPFMLAVQFPSWALYEGWWEDPTYIGPKKCITVSPDWNHEQLKEDGSFFYNDDDRQAIILAREEERQNPESYKVERRGQFAEVIDAYLPPEMVDRMYSGKPDEYGRVEALKTNWNEHNYNFRYKMHLDPSSTTAGFGFAIGHTEHLLVGDTMAEHVVFDVIKRWRPQEFPEGVIDWEVVIAELIRYIEIFAPYEVTFDQFQSAAPIQFIRRALRERGIDTRVYEKTATSQYNWNRAEVFKTALYQNLVHAPADTEDSHFSSMELKYLQVVMSSRIPRVEKQEVGPVQTKDMADCVMEVTEALIGNVIARAERESLGDTPIRAGSFMGYPIGGLDRGGMGQSPFAEFYNRRSGEQSGMGNSQGMGRNKNKKQRSWGAAPTQRRFPGH